MTLIVLVYKVDRQSGAIVFNIDLPPGEELGGFEDWRETFWGSDETIAWGAVFLPKLKERDLYIEDEDLTVFIQECELLIKHYHDRASIKCRLNNFIKAAEKAIAINGGILIDV